MKEKTRLSLKIKLGLAITLVGIIPIIISATVSIGLARKTILDAKNESLQSIAEAKKSIIESLLYSNYVNTKLIAGKSTFESPDSSKDEIKEELVKINTIYPEYDDLSVVNLDGHVIASINYDYEGKWLEKDWFLEAKEGKTTISGVQTILDPFHTVIIFATPIIDENDKTRAILITQLPIDRVWASIEENVDRNSRFTILADENKRIIYHPSSEELFNTLPQGVNQYSQNKGGFFQTVQNGESLLVGYETFDDEFFSEMNWKIFVFEKESVVLKAISSLELSIIAASIGALIIAAVFGFRLGFQFLKPIKELKTAARNIGKGKLSFRANVKTHDEFSELAKIFNEMAEKIENLSKNLEKKVKQKTKELEEKNRVLKKSNAVMVGRELKMIKLKEEIDSLKQESKGKRE